MNTHLKRLSLLALLVTLVSCGGGGGGGGGGSKPTQPKPVICCDQKERERQELKESLKALWEKLEWSESTRDELSVFSKSVIFGQKYAQAESERRIYLGEDQLVLIFERFNQAAMDKTVPDTYELAKEIIK